jgi:hypothetical protein
LNGFVMAGRRCEASIEHRLKQMKEDGRRWRRVEKSSQTEKWEIVM